MDLQQQNEKIVFPVSFKLKIISIIYDTEKSAFDRFDKILDSNKINHSGWDCKPSSGGKYASYRVDVTINDNQTFQNLYADLGEIEGVKCVI
ncbi:MAG: DUF493 family protein [Spirochaetales bacterium]|uniref:DUF493 family protein n=1 Tax=Candidatus Thalassospirochaeta sargassi TaxID=3119039 RepID=A0AAJ1MMF3_9SPIO|nr:DUF493 family protein [Spirochaetales bacterium]